MDKACTQAVAADVVEPEADGETVERAKPATAEEPPGSPRRKPALPEWIMGLALLPPRC